MRTIRIVIAYLLVLTLCFAQSPALSLTASAATRPPNPVFYTNFDDINFIEAVYFTLKWSNVGTPKYRLQKYFRYHSRPDDYDYNEYIGQPSTFERSYSSMNSY